jgi:beta-mannosidase
MSSQSLNGAWSLYTFAQRGSPVHAPADLAAHTPIAAEVPGVAQLDMVRAGLLEDPYYAQNILALRPLEQNEWWYSRSFVPDALPGAAQSAVLHFEGVDCVAEYFLNGQRFGESDNMLIEHEFDVTGLLRPGANELVVHIFSPIEVARVRALDCGVLAASLAGGHESLLLRRAPSSYGWDILCRAVTSGLWRGVSLAVREPHRVEQLYIATRHLRPDGGNAGLRLHYALATDDPDLDALTLRLALVLEGTPVLTLERPLWFVAGNWEFDLPDPQLWWPFGYGEQPLYTAQLSLLRRGAVLCAKAVTLGVRTIQLERSDTTTQEGDGEFKFVVNGVPILCKGSNWVPLDAFHSRDAARYAPALALLRESNCNIVRCWGGNVYEDHAFFDLCDRYGLLVWQDFSMACCIYPRQERFFAAMEQEAAFIVRKLRQHPSLALWCGDNECDDFSMGWGVDPNTNPLTRERLRTVVANNDFYRAYLPSSPYLSPRSIAERLPKPEQHLWGPRDYYKSNFYQTASAHFVSEIGYHGCPNRASLEKFLSPAALWPWQGNAEWITHASDFTGQTDGPYAYRIRLMADQIRELFGTVPEDLDDFILASQISQAEAKKSFIEMTRLQKWRRTGIIWWNMLDGWPQFSDAVVDWYWGKKLAFTYIQRAQAPLCLLLTEPQDWHCKLVAGNDSRSDFAGTYRMTDAQSGEALLAGSFVSKANQNTELAKMRVSRGEHKIFLIEWEADGQAGRNHYLLGNPPFDLTDYKKILQEKLQ